MTTQSLIVTEGRGLTGRKCPSVKGDYGKYWAIQVLTPDEADGKTVAITLPPLEEALKMTGYIANAKVMSASSSFLRRQESRV